MVEAEFRELAVRVIEVADMLAMVPLEMRGTANSLVPARPRSFVCQLTGSCLGCSLNSEDNEGWFSPMRTPPSAEKDQAGDHPFQYFELGKSLSYYDGKGIEETVVYEGASPVF